MAKPRASFRTRRVKRRIAREVAGEAGAHPGSQIRRGDRRRRVGGPLYAPPPARTRPVGPRLRSRRRHWRNLVLEPLSRRALRRREHGLLLLFFGRASAGM